VACRDMVMLKLVALTALLLPAAAQLRPRRVGLGSLGDQAPDGSEMGADATMAGLAEALGGANAENGMLEGLKGMMESNPELADLAANPEKLQEKMAEMMKMMSSPEGQELGSKMMAEMQSVLTDPDKMRQGLEQFATNPMLKGMADAIPGLKEVLDDPEAMEKSIAEAQKAMAEMGGLEGMQEKMAEMMAGLGGEGGNLAQMLENPEVMAAAKQAASLLQGGDGSGLADMLGSGGDGELADRVREQLAGLMRDRGGDADATGGVDIESEEF